VRVRVRDKVRFEERENVCMFVYVRTYICSHIIYHNHPFDGQVVVKWIDYCQYLREADFPTTPTPAAGYLGPRAQDASRNRRLEAHTHT